MNASASRPSSGAIELLISVFGVATISAPKGALFGASRSGWSTARYVRLKPGGRNSKVRTLFERQSTELCGSCRSPETWSGKTLAPA